MSYQCELQGSYRKPLLCIQKLKRIQLIDYSVSMSYQNSSMSITHIGTAHYCIESYSSKYVYNCKNLKKQTTPFTINYGSRYFTFLQKLALLLHVVNRVEVSDFSFPFNINEKRNKNNIINNSNNNNNNNNSLNERKKKWNKFNRWKNLNKSI